MLSQSHTTKNDTYGGSAVKGNFLLLAFNTGYSHMSLPIPVTETELATLRIDSGEGLVDNCQTAITTDSGYFKTLDMVSAGETGIYMLADVKAGTVRYVKSGANYTFSQNSIVLVLLALDDTTAATYPTILWVDVEAYPRPASYSPVSMLPYYPSGTEKYGVPNFLLLSHIDPASRTGIVFYSIATVTCPAQGSVPSSQNPFVTATGCNDAKALRCFSANIDYSVHCVDEYYLGDMFTCTSAACPDGYYLASGKSCAACHYSCLTCSGPTRSECLSCDTSIRTFEASTRACGCIVGKLYEYNGGCVASCNAGMMGYTDAGSCREICPSYTLHYVGYSSAASSDLSKMSASGYSGGTDLLEFKSGSTACLKLPGPKGVSQVPDQFTASFWVNRDAGWADATRTLLWGFNTFKVVVVTSAGADTVNLLLMSSAGVGLTTTGASLVSGWNYVAISTRRTSTSIDTILYTTTDVTTPGTAHRSSAASVFSYPTYANTMLLGCDGSFDVSTSSVSSVASVAYSAYFRDLAYLNRYHELYSLHANKNRAYVAGMEIYAQVLAYWRFDSIQATASDYVVTDESISVNTVTFPLAGNPTKSLNTAASFSNAVWENAGKCADLFLVGLFPAVSVDPIGFSLNGLQYKINMYSASVVKDLLTTQDTVQFYHSGCSNGTPIQSMKVSFGTALQLQSIKPLPISVYGTYVDVCYFSAILPRPIKLGQVYFPLVPDRVSPAHGASDGQNSATISFVLSGGDQSAHDVLMMLSMETSVMSKMGDAFLVDESLSTYSDYIMPRSSSGTYSILTDNLDTATYTLLWRPAYLTYRAANGLAEYKNLYVLWSVQDTPKIRFSTLSDGSGVTENGVAYKAEFYELNLIGPAQSDGDQVLFCISGCHYSNRRGLPYTRNNGKYPPVWLGEEQGVTNLQSSNDNRLFICWRPAARAATLGPEEDTWSSVREDSAEAGKAYITADSMTDNIDLIEIIDINPPFKNRVLHEGESIWFKLSKCSTRKVKPSCDGSGVAGRVQVVHLTYTSADFSTYTTTVIWEQLFTSAASSSDDGFSVGKLYGDPLTCNYTITGLPTVSLIPGDTYRLIIYSKSFKSPIMNNYFLGDIDSGVAQLQYEFMYQEAHYTWAQHKIPPSQTELDIPGRFLGDVVASGAGRRRLFGVNVTLSATCTSGVPSAGYRVLSFTRDSPDSIRLTDLSLASCSGILTAAIKLIKLYEYDEKPLWSYSNETLTLGEIGCYSACATCNGTGKYNCTSCTNATDFMYLYKGECTNKCGVESPYAYQDTADSEIYFHCFSVCPSGYFANKLTNECSACNTQCKTCTSDEIMSCTSCQSIVVDPDSSWTEDSKVYTDKYYFSHMCVVTCPNITNDISAAHEDLVSIDNVTHYCYLKVPPTGAHPISVSIQPLPYRSRVNLQDSLKLRVLIDDPTDSFAGISWQAHPAEDLTVSGFNTSDKRTFSSYDEDYLSGQVVGVNLNSLNYLTNNDEKHIIVKVRTSDSMAVAFTELFGNLVMDFKSATFVLSPAKPTAMSTFNVAVGGVDDPDDGQDTLKFRVTLETVSLAVDESKVSSSVLATTTFKTSITTRIITLFASKSMSTASANLMLSGIYVPPLIVGPQEIADGITTNIVTCTISVRGEDRYQGASIYSVQLNVTDPYTASMRSAAIENLYAETVLAAQHANFSWDLALKISNTFMTIIPSPKTYYQSYAGCARDSQCGEGKCETAAGRGHCICETGFVGRTCQWTEGELRMARRLTGDTLSFLNFTLIDPVVEKLNRSYVDFYTDDMVASLQLANVLEGVLVDSELVDSDYEAVVVQLCDYVARISMHVAQRLDEDEKVCILNGLDSVAKYLLRSMRDEIYQYYLLNDKKATSSAYEAEYVTMRERMAGEITRVRDALYGFLNMISVAQYSGAAAFRKKFGAFEVFLVAATKDTLFEDLGDELGIQLSSENGFVRIPQSILTDLDKSVSDGEEFMIRIVTWFESPYVFSTSNPEVFTTVQNVAILNNNASEITLDLTSPIILFLPPTNWTRNFPQDRVRCRLFNSSLMVNATRVRTVKLATGSDTVNPQMSGYSSIVEATEYYTGLAKLPDFVDSDGVADYGGMLRSGDYADFVPCAIYQSGEVAAVVTRKKSQELETYKNGFYYYFDPLAYWKVSLGFYTCMAMVGFFGCFYIAAFYLDKRLIPRLERLIQLNRRDYSLDDTEMVDMAKPHGETKLRAYAGKDRYGEGETEAVDRSKQNETQDPRDGSPPGTSASKVRPSRSQKQVRQDNKEQSLEKVEVEQSTELAMVKSKDDPRRHSEAGVVTTQALTTQEPASLALRTNVAMQEDDPEGFANVRPVDIRNKVKVDERVEDVFSIEHIEKREEYQYSLGNLILQGNLFTNFFMRTNTTLLRTTRCITLFVSIYLQMFWSAAFIAATNSVLDHPDDFARVMQMIGNMMWIPFASPCFTMILLYLFAALFKVSDNRVLQTKTFDQYRRLQYFCVCAIADRKELSREMWLRKLMAYIIAASAVVGANYYVCRFSALYGYYYPFRHRDRRWKMSSVWFWSFILGMVIDAVLYDVGIAVIESLMFKYARSVASFVYTVRSVKQAGIQE